VHFSIDLSTAEFIIGSILGAVVPTTYFLIKAYFKLNGDKK